MEAREGGESKRKMQIGSIFTIAKHSRIYTLPDMTPDQTPKELLGWERGATRREGEGDRASRGEWWVGPCGGCEGLGEP